MFEQLKEKYISSFEEKTTQLENALANNDSQALSVLVHQMAGSSGSYGFHEISDCCQEIEEMLHDGELINNNITQRTQDLIQLMIHS